MGIASVQPGLTSWSLKNGTHLIEYSRQYSFRGKKCNFHRDRRSLLISFSTVPLAVCLLPSIFDSRVFSLNTGPHVSCPVCIGGGRLCRIDISPFASSASSGEIISHEDEFADGNGEEKISQKVNRERIGTSQSSWDAKNMEGKDYLYRIGQESENLNVTVGARQGMIDDLFVGDFLGKDSDIVFTYRQKVTRSFQHIQGDYYIPPAFMEKVGVCDFSELLCELQEKVVTHIVKNYLISQLDCEVPLILGVWGGKGQGKSFQIELIFKAMGVEPVIMSAGELESEWAGQPGRLIRERYRTASRVVKLEGKMSCLVINDLDAGIGRFANTQVTVNNQMVFGTLMNLADNPTCVSIGQDWRQEDIVDRVPIIVTGNDFTTLWAPLIRDGRMDKFYWQPTREDIINIVYQMYSKDGLSKRDVSVIVDTFPNQAIDFYGALRSRTYDKHVLKWVEGIGGAKRLGETLSKGGLKKPEFTPPEQTVDSLLEAGQSLVEEQMLVNSMRLSDQYMKKQIGAGSTSLLSSY